MPCEFNFRGGRSDNVQEVFFYKIFINDVIRLIVHQKGRKSSLYKTKLKVE